MYSIMYSIETIPYFPIHIIFSHFPHVLASYSHFHFRMPEDP